MVGYPQLAPEQRERFLNILDRYNQRELNNNRGGALRKLFDHTVARGGRLRSPLVVIMDLTNKCNQNCIFCYREGQKGLGGREEDWLFRSLEDLETIFEDLKAMNVASVALTGGEATCHPRFLDALALAKSFGFATTLVTNGTAFREGQVRALSAILDPACDRVELSLDAAEPVAYGKIRQAGRFNRLLTTLKEFRDYEIPFSTMTLLVRDNAAQALDILHLACEHNPRAMALEPPFPKAHIEDPGIYARPEEVLTAYEAVLDCPRLADRTVTFNFLHFSIMAGVYHDVQQTLGITEESLAGCHAGHASCTIDIRGDVHLCQYLISAGTSHVGNISRSPLSGLWAGAQEARGAAASGCSRGCLAFALDRRSCATGGELSAAAGGGAES